MRHLALRIALFGALLGAMLVPAPAPAQSLDGATRDAATQQITDRLGALRERQGSRRGGVIGLFGYNAIPDGSTNAVEITRGQLPTALSPTLQLGQTGFGFTVSEAFPLFLETYIGYARYDPRIFVSGGNEAQRMPLRWNNVIGTVGVGYDIRLAEYLWLRPIINGSLGHAASDAALLGNFINWRRDTDISFLTNKQMNVYGLGGALMLAYYDYTPARNIDVELRYSEMRLQTYGDTPQAISGSSTARTLGLWGRYRWPMGIEAFGRPMRWVLDGSGSLYLGDQREAIGFGWAVKVGGGIEFDVGRHEISAAGISLSRVRLIARYFYGDGGITGTSVGIGMSF